jgi:hypothetical protein
MRAYKPRTAVIAALRKSSFLVVSDDGKTIWRKLPLQGPCALDPDFYNDDEIAYDPRARKPAVIPVPLLPQKKAVYPPGITKNMLKPTGFEYVTRHHELRRNSSSTFLEFCNNEHGHLWSVLV